MSVVFSHSLILGTSTGGGIDPLSSPMIGWDNRVARQGASATSSADNHPALLVGNPSTAEYWAAATAAGTQSVTVPLMGEETVIEYVGIARHNFGATGAQVRLMTRVGEGAWTELMPWFLPGDDSVIFVRVPSTRADQLRVDISGGSAAPRMAVLSAGPVLRMQRNIYVGHSPLPLARDVTVSTAVTESGQFQGRIVTGESHSTSADFANLTPDWYRSEFEPFAQASDELPFFFAWRPKDYPLEVGYCWLKNVPQPTNQLNNGMMQVSMTMQGIVRRNSAIIIADPMRA